MIQGQATVNCTGNLSDPPGGGAGRAVPGVGADFSTIGDFCSVRVWAGGPTGYGDAPGLPSLPCSPIPGCPERVEAGHADARIPRVIGEAGWRWGPPGPW